MLIPLGAKLASSILAHPIQRSFMSSPFVPIVQTSCRLVSNSIKNPLSRRMISYQPQVVQSPPNSTATLLGAGGLMLSTYLVLNQLLNQPGSESLSISSKTITPSIHAYLKGTYSYVAGGIAITAVSAMTTYRTGGALRILRTNPMLYFAGSVAGVLGMSLLTQSISHKDSPGAKHLAWAATMASVGALSLSPVLFLPPVVISRAALYTVGVVGSLSLVAINAEDGKFLYLGGPLFTGLTVVALSGVAGVFLPTAGAAFNITQAVSLYGGLAVFGGLMLYDTQTIIEEARHNTDPEPDFIDKSFTIYWNIVNIFIRMVQIVGSGQNRSRK